MPVPYLNAELRTLNAQRRSKTPKSSILTANSAHSAAAPSRETAEQCFYTHHCEPLRGRNKLRDWRLAASPAPKKPLRLCASALNKTEPQAPNAKVPKLKNLKPLDRSFL